MSREITLRPLRLLIAAGAALTILVALAGAGPSKQERVRQSAACLECHEGEDATLAGSAHWGGKVHDGVDAEIACTDCHDGDLSKHEDDAEKNPMGNPAKLGALAEVQVCTRCHENSHQQNMIERNVHTANGVACSSCHEVHGAKEASLLRKPEPELCESCHTREVADFARPYRHPVEEGIVKCSDCHLKLDKTARDLSFNGTSVCLKCHGEFAGPFPYEHQATLDHSTEEGGCLSCHDAHGSSLPRMLKQPYEPPHQQLCTQCHSIPARHLSNPMHGTRWAAVACNDCHTDIHGSYDNPYFLGASVRAQGCLVRGCHGH